MRNIIRVDKVKGGEGNTEQRYERQRVDLIEHFIAVGLKMQRDE